MGTIPPVPVFPAGQAAQGEQLEAVCYAISWCMSLRPLAILQQGIAQTVATGGLVAVTWDTKVSDRDGGWSSGANTRYTAQTPGVYLLSANVVYTANATGDRQLVFRLTTGTVNPLGSGVTQQFGVAGINSPSGFHGNVTSTFLTPYMFVSDYVEVMTSQDSGGNLATIVAGSVLPFFTITLVSS